MKNVKSSEKKILIVLAAIAIIAFIIALNMNYDKEKEEEVIDSNVLALTDENRFITITSAIDSYISNVKYKNIENLMILLDKKYIEENKVNSNNVLYVLDTYNDNYIANVREVYQIKKYDNIYVYYVKAKLLEENFDSIMQNYIKDIYFRVTINENTLAFSIAPIDSEEYISKVGEQNG